MKAKRFGVLEPGGVVVHAESRYQPGGALRNAKCARQWPRHRTKDIRAKKGPLAELTCEGCIAAEEREAPNEE